MCNQRGLEINPEQACVVPGHQIAEMAMARLYVLTGGKEVFGFCQILNWTKRGYTETQRRIQSGTQTRS